MPMGLSSLASPPLPPLLFLTAILTAQVNCHLVTSRAFVVCSFPLRRRIDNKNFPGLRSRYDARKIPHTCSSSL
ncbi:hypothetical protein LZ31DRAFT_556805 [Colletotrichum somersetense]|nr:hypothetical protein LZ31DRAFT_556805 [Colletotrichum somersetense]